MRLRKWSEAEDGLSLVTDALDGETLAEWASRTRADLTPAALAELGTRIVVAMGLLHGAGVAHGALSASTVLRGRDGRLQLGEPTLDSSATPAGDLRDAAALLRSLVPEEAWWVPDAAMALHDVASIAALQAALYRLGRLDAVTEQAPAPEGVLPTAPGAPGAPELSVEAEEALLPRDTLSSRRRAQADAAAAADPAVGTLDPAALDASPELELDVIAGPVPLDIEGDRER